MKASLKQLHRHYFIFKPVQQNQSFFWYVMAVGILCREHEQKKWQNIHIDSADSAISTWASDVSFDSVSVQKQAFEKGTERFNENGEIVVADEKVLLSHALTYYHHGAALFPGRQAKCLKTDTLVFSSVCLDNVVLRSPRSAIKASSIIETASGVDKSLVGAGEYSGKETALRQLFKRFGDSQWTSYLWRGCFHSCSWCLWLEGCARASQWARRKMVTVAATLRHSSNYKLFSWARALNWRHFGDPWRLIWKCW